MTTVPLAPAAAPVRWRAAAAYVAMLAAGVGLFFLVRAAGANLVAPAAPAAAVPVGGGSAG